MSLYEEAASNPDASLFELNPFAEMDLHLIISMFEEENKNSGTEDGYLLSAYGDIGKQKGRLGSFRDTTNSYGGMYEGGVSATGEGGTASASVEIDPTTGLAFAEASWSPPPNPFSNCFPCDLRLTSILDSLPMPDFLQWFEEIIAMVERFIKIIEGLLDPTNYYSQLCSLIDMTRVICPQDLILLVTALSFMVVMYVKLLVRFDFDWLALVGIIFLPLLLLLYSLIDMILQVTGPPLTCLIDMLEAMWGMMESGVDLANATASSVATTAAGAAQSAASVASSTAAVTGQDEAAAEINANAGAIPHPIETDFLSEEMGEAMQDMQIVESLILSISSYNISTPEMFTKFKKVLRVLIEMFSGGDAMKLQIIAALIQLARLIGFLKAIIDLLQQGDAICTDPEIPLSTQDVQNVLERLQRDPGSDPQPGSLPPTTSINLNEVTGLLTVSDTVSGNVVEVPMCLGATTGESRDQINEWIQQLDAANL